MKLTRTMLYPAVLALAALLGGVGTSLAAESHIMIRLSFKLLKDAGAGPNPSGTVSNINSLIATANEVMDRQQRGYRFVASEIIEVDPNVVPPTRTYYITPSHIPRDLSIKNFYQWWDDYDPSVGCDQPQPPFLGYRTVDQTTLETIEPFYELVPMFFESVLTHKTEFRYRNDQANVYVMWGAYCGGQGAFPSCDAAENNMYIISGTGPDVGSVALFLHEFGHYANLQHPFYTVETISKNAVGTESPDVTDTPPDAWVIDPIPPDATPPNARWSPLALRFYSLAYAALTAAQKDQVRLMDKIGQLRALGTDPYSAGEIEGLWQTWANLMSYHKAEPRVEDWRYSEMQLDIMGDTFSQPAPCGRSAVATGRTWFASVNGTVGAPNTSAFPYPLNWATGLTASQGGDIVLLREGAYNVQPTLHTPMTLRVARGTRATLGSATPH